jgi:hypothetical protein
MIEMKRTLSVLLVCMYTFTAAAQKNFEGEIEYVVKFATQTYSINIQVAAMKMNYQVTMNDSASLQKEQGELITHDYGNEIFYIHYSKSKTTYADSFSMKAQPASKPLLVKKTGRTKLILGYGCEELKVTDSTEKDTDKSSFFIWICDTLRVSMPQKYAADFAGEMPVIFNAHPVMEASLSGAAGKSVTVFSITAVSVTPGQLPAEVFGIPPGNKVVNFKQMLDDLEKAGRTAPPPPLKKGEKIRAKPKSKRKQ